MKLRSPRRRDELLAAVVKYNKNKEKVNKLNSNDLGIAGPRSSVFVSEHLTPTNKYLHAAVRKRAKEANYRFVWVRNGRIFVRKSEEDANVILIRNLKCLDKLV